MSRIYSIPGLWTPRPRHATRVVVPDEARAVHPKLCAAVGCGVGTAFQPRILTPAHIFDPGQLVAWYDLRAPSVVTYLGAGPGELVANGEFASSASWTEGTHWAIGAGVAAATGALAAEYLSQTCLTSGARCRVTYTVSGYSSGTVTAYCGTAAGTARSANGTYTEDITANGTDLKFGGSAGGFTGAIDNVSVIELPGARRFPNLLDPAGTPLEQTTYANMGWANPTCWNGGPGLQTDGVAHYYTADALAANWSGINKPLVAIAAIQKTVTTSQRYLALTSTGGANFWELYAGPANWGSYKRDDVGTADDESLIGPAQDTLRHVQAYRHTGPALTQDWWIDGARVITDDPANSQGQFTANLLSLAMTNRGGGAPAAFMAANCAGILLAKSATPAQVEAASRWMMSRYGV